MSNLQPFLIAIIVFLLALLIGGLIFRAARGSTIPGPKLSGTRDGKYTVVGSIVTCSQCGHDRFKLRETLLNTWFLSLIHLDWLDPAASALICENCGKLNWFSQATTTEHRGDGA